MMNSRFIFAALAVSAVAACDPPVAVVPAVPPPSDACGASAYSGLIGKDRAAANTVQLKEPVRIIGPDMAVTADYRPDRLNIEHDASGKITKVSCY